MRVKRLLLLFSIGLGIILLDFYTKKIVSLHFFQTGNERICFFENFLGLSCFIEYVTNRGAAWGLFSSWQLPLLLFRCLLVLGLIGYLLAGKAPAFQHCSLILILSGAIGNIIDSFYYGYVIDLFHFTFFHYSFPVFNIADSAIFCGISSLALLHFFLRKKELPSLQI
jgi:signal peptidase II